MRAKAGLAQPGQKTGYREGFTLLEALVCLAITALVAVLVLDAVRLAGTGAIRIERFVRSELGARIDMIALRDAVSGSRAEHVDTMHAFSGDAGSFNGYTTRSVMPASAGSANYTVELIRETGTVTLVYREQTGGEDEEAGWHVMSWPADAARFEYRDDLTGAWVESWPIVRRTGMTAGLQQPGAGPALPQPGVTPGLPAPGGLSDPRRNPFCAYLPAAIRLTVEADGEPVYGLILAPASQACPPSRPSDMARM